MEVKNRKIDWSTMLIPFAIVIALMAVFMIVPDKSKSVVDIMRGFLGIPSDSIILYLLLVVWLVHSM